VPDNAGGDDGADAGPNDIENLWLNPLCPSKWAVKLKGISGLTKREFKNGTYLLFTLDVIIIMRPCSVITKLKIGRF
jgi:hypothetical protein